MTRVAAVILAAGQASRYRAMAPEAPSKVVALLDGKPLVRHVADTALASQARPVIVVTGHAQADVEMALSGLPVTIAHNADYATGMASSLRRGLEAAGEVDGIIVLLADMPRIGFALIDALLQAFAKHPEADAVIAIHEGRRGNPVLLGRNLFEAIRGLEGDEGARRLLAGKTVVEVAGDETIALDIDTPEALRQVQK